MDAHCNCIVHPFINTNKMFPMESGLNKLVQSLQSNGPTYNQRQKVIREGRIHIVFYSRRIGQTVQSLGSSVPTYNLSFTIWRGF